MEDTQATANPNVVLIADDEKSLAQAIAATLSQEGLKPIVTHDGDKALRKAVKLKPDLILLDVMMPGRSGIEVCARLKTNPETASIPVVLITAKGDESDRRVGIAAGADGYLTKPFSPTKLIKLVQDIFAGEPVEPRLYSADDISAMPSEQLEIYARELGELFAQEQRQRKQLEEAQARLEEIDRLKRSFLSVVTHELLTPFSSIGLSLQVLQQRTEGLKEDQKEALDDLMTEIAGLHRMVSGVVKFAELVNKRREPQPGHIELHKVVPWAIQPAAVLAQSREIDFRVFVPDHLPKLYADPDLVGEAAFQMAHNAVKFNLPGGEAQVRAFEDGHWLTIEVKDTGVGLTEEQMERLGQPFEQTADSLRRGKEGLGIGWAFVRYVAEVHGGWTHVDSAGPDQGSRFSLGLPLSTDEKDPGRFLQQINHS